VNPERLGWVMLAIGIGVCALVWLAFSLLAHLFGIQLGEALF
jgi:hypothetical protein